MSARGSLSQVSRSLLELRGLRYFVMGLVPSTVYTSTYASASAYTYIWFRAPAFTVTLF